MLLRFSKEMSAVLTPGAGVQNDLPLFNKEKVRKYVDETGQQLAYLLSILRDAKWHTAKELKVYGFTDRELRELVENSDGKVFSFPGSPGYKLFDFVTEDEFLQSEALRNQARSMLRRYARYRRRHHRGD
jgi:hypothetical protein